MTPKQLNKLASLVVKHKVALGKLAQSQTQVEATYQAMIDHLDACRPVEASAQANGTTAHTTQS